LESHLPLFRSDLDHLAKQTGAVARWKKIKNASMLLRMALIWTVVKNMSLDTVAAWALEHLDLNITGSALGQRFAKLRVFLLALIGQLETDSQTRSGVIFRIVDGSVFSLPGSSGSDFRWHVAYDPDSARLTSCSLTDDKGSEAFSRTKARAIDVLMGDSYYGKAPLIHEAQRRDCRCLCRVYLPQIRLFDAKGRRINPDELRKRERKGALTEEIAVTVPWEDEVLQARLLIAPLPKEIAARTREKLRKAARKKGRTLSRERSWLAGYWFLVTTMDCELITAQLAAELYRVRWQVEIFFKRAKSLHEMSDIKKGRKELEKVQILLKVLYIMILQSYLGTNWNRWKVKGERGRYSAMPSSIWRQSVLLDAKFCAALVGPVRQMKLTERVRLKLSERPRRRRYTCEALDIFREAILPFNPTMFSLSGGLCA